VKKLLPVAVNAESPLGDWDNVTEIDIIISSCCIGFWNVQGYFNAVKMVPRCWKKDDHLVLLGGFWGNAYQVTI